MAWWYGAWYGWFTRWSLPLGAMSHMQYTHTCKHSLSLSPCYPFVLYYIHSFLTLFLVFLPFLSPFSMSVFSTPRFSPLSSPLSFPFLTFPLLSSFLLSACHPNASLAVVMLRCTAGRHSGWMEGREQGERGREVGGVLWYRWFKFLAWEGF